MLNKNKKYVAACLGSGVMLAALALSQNFEDGNTYAAEKVQKESELSLAVAGTEAAQTEAAVENAVEEGSGLSLALADDTTTEAAAETEAPAELATEAPTEAPEELTTEAPTEAPASYDTLETTATGEDGVVALDVSGIVESCMPSIVSITNNSVQEVQGYYLYGTQEIETESAGSGIIIAQNDTELMIATNRHVVADSNTITVCFTVDAEKEEDLVVPAVTKGMDSEYDLAVIAVKLSDIPSEVLSQLKIATLGSSSKLKVGETAIAIGNALGTGQTVTSGIISAVEREITTDVGTFTEIQTDAAINLGCSGGALLNKRGEVIGINSAKATTDYAESMGYAIPIDTAIPVLTDLINRETRDVQENHGYMGITVVPVSDEAKEMYNMPAGAFVYEVSEGSAGEAAGLKKGDIITKFDGVTISSSDELVSTLGYYTAGETVTIEVQSADNGAYTSKELQVTLQEGSTDAAADDSQQGTTEQQVPQEDGQTQDGQEQQGEDLYGYYDDGSQGSSQDDMFNQFYDYFFNGGDDSYYGSNGDQGTLPYGQDDSSNPGL